MVQTVTMPDGTVHNFPDEATPQMIETALGLRKEEKSFIDRISEDYSARDAKVQQAQNSYISGQQSLPEASAQILGNGIIGFTNDVAGEVLASGFRALPDTIESPIREGASDVLNYLAGTDIGGAAVNAAKTYSDFSEQNPRAGRNIDALFNIGSVFPAFAGAKSATPSAPDIVSNVRSSVSSAAPVINNAITSAPAAVARPIANAALYSADTLSNSIDNAATSASRYIARNNLAPELRNLPDADVLFLKQFDEAQVPYIRGAQNLEQFSKQGLTPNPGIVNDIEKLRGISDLTARGTAGSKIARDSLNQIRESQIPRLNRKLIETATDAPIKTAEEYGNAVSVAAKNIVDAQVNKLRTRAKPYYEASVGADKVVPENEFTKSVLTSPKAAEALQKWRTDTDVLETVQNDLGIEMAKVTSIPNNSTLALHSARVALRKEADALARNGQSTAAQSAAIRKIDAAIESAYPKYKLARSTYSEDAGALKTLKESPLGQMATISDGNLSQISNNLLSRDAQYIRKFMSSIDRSGVDNPQKMKDSIVGAYLKNALEKTGDETLSYRQKILGGADSKAANNLKALTGDVRYNQIVNVADTLDKMTATAKILNGSQTAGLQTLRESERALSDVPTGIMDALNKTVAKINPSLLDIISKNPEQSRRLAELLYTDEGLKLLKKASGTEKLTVTRINAVGDFLEKLKGNEFPDPAAVNLTVRPSDRR